MPVIVRRAVPKDAETLAVIAATVWVETYVPRGVSARFASHICEEHSVQRYTERLRLAYCCMWIAEVNGLAVGFLRLDLQSPCPSNPTLNAEIATLYVLPAQQRQGTGAELMAAALAFLAETGIEHAWLTVNAENSTALQFYERHRWMRIGTYEFEIDSEPYPNLVLKSPPILCEGIVV